jgi:hypothetical protein
MTIALCLNCGEQKIGAFSPCPHCQFTPKTEEEWTKSLLMSDHHVTIEELETAGEKITNGEELEFDEQALKAIWVTTEQMTEVTRRARKQWFTCLTLVILMIAAISYLTYLALH